MLKIVLQTWNLHHERLVGHGSELMIKNRKRHEKISNIQITHENDRLEN